MQLPHRPTARQPRSFPIVLSVRSRSSLLFLTQHATSRKPHNASSNTGPHHLRSGSSMSTRRHRHPKSKMNLRHAQSHPLPEAISFQPTHHPSLRTLTHPMMTTRPHGSSRQSNSSNTHQHKQPTNHASPSFSLRPGMRIHSSPRTTPTRRLPPASHVRQRRIPA